jgi:hypothetical protein
MEQLLKTRLTEAYGVAHPVVNAGMGLVAATPALAMPGFNPYRVPRNPRITEDEARAAEVPSDLSGEPQIGVMQMGPDRVPLHRFRNFIPTPQTERGRPAVHAGAVGRRRVADAVTA